MRRLSPSQIAGDKESVTMMTIYDFSARLGTGAERRLADYRGKVLLVVNVASQCGFTPQYTGLQKLYEQFSRAALKFSASPVISSAIRNRGQTPKSQSSAIAAMALLFRFSPKSK
jgi:glutathione peroxidase-family protein